MFLLSNWRLLLAGGFLLAIAAGSFAAYRHYQGLVDDLVRLRSENSSLQVQSSAWEERAKRLAELAEEAQRVRREARREERRLNELFSEHDLAALARGKPALVERRINDGSDRVFRMLECATDPACDAAGAKDATAGADRDAAGPVASGDSGDDPRGE